MVIFSHKQEVCQSEDNQHCHRVRPLQAVRYGKQAARDYQLQDKIKGGNRSVRDMQLVGHQLVGVLAVRLAQMLVQKDAVDDGQDGIHTIDPEQQQILNISGGCDQAAQGEKDDEGDAHGTDVTCKAPGPFPEIEETEYQH